jgi:hypothetical protein
MYIVRYSKENKVSETGSVRWWLLALYNGRNRVGVSRSPEDGNRSVFRNVVFFLEYRLTDRVQKASNPECYKYIMARIL